MKPRTLVASLVLLLTGALITNAASDERNAFREISGHYEAIRLSLVKDTMTGVAKHAGAIEHRARELGVAFEAQAAGVPEENSSEAATLLSGLASAAALLAEAESLEQARHALFELSKPLGRYRKLAGIEGSMVVFCSMAEKAWIQPHGEIGNPYGGAAMSSCGEVIAD